MKVMMMMTGTAASYTTTTYHVFVAAWTVTVTGIGISHCTSCPRKVCSTGGEWIEGSVMLSHNYTYSTATLLQLFLELVLGWKKQKLLFRMHAMESGCCLWAWPWLYCVCVEWRCLQERKKQRNKTDSLERQSRTTFNFFIPRHLFSVCPSSFLVEQTPLSLVGMGNSFIQFFDCDILLYDLQYSLITHHNKSQSCCCSKSSKSLFFACTPSINLE